MNPLLRMMEDQIFDTHRNFIRELTSILLTIAIFRSKGSESNLLLGLVSSSSLLKRPEIEAKVCREFPETENPSRRALSLSLSCTDSLSSLSPPRRRSLSLSSPAPCGGGGDRISTFSYPCFQIKIYAKVECLEPNLLS
ncbi:hypothetical protein DY000_02022454 [Brassica cretica]|uniref:Uncharacterized protein n=1 Tax=Brassica cretica TaxID=69181 RepID=A0ABQ7E8E6_BRACR|nr:hypothetical protein DY000_02022454 [Brassica cretica]